MQNVRSFVFQSQRQIEYLLIDLLCEEDSRVGADLTNDSRSVTAFVSSFLIVDDIADPQKERQELEEKLEEILLFSVNH